MTFVDFKKAFGLNINHEKIELIIDLVDTLVMLEISGMLGVNISSMSGGLNIWDAN